MSEDLSILFKIAIILLFNFKKPKLQVNQYLTSKTHINKSIYEPHKENINFMRNEISYIRKYLETNKL